MIQQTLESREIVLIENPAWIQRETTTVLASYNALTAGGNMTTKIYSFGISPTTVCKLLKDGTVIKPQDALEGARYGWYECWLSCPNASPVSTATAVQERTAFYQRDNGPIVGALSMAALFVALAALFGK